MPSQVPPPVPPSRVLLNDASELDATVLRAITFAAGSTEQTAQRMIPLLQSISRGTEPSLVVSGARHSMGGHSLLTGGWVMAALPMKSVAVNAAAGTAVVGGGATWKDVVEVLTPPVSHLVEVHVEILSSSAGRTNYQRWIAR